MFPGAARGQVVPPTPTRASLVLGPAWFLLIGGAGAGAQEAERRQHRVRSAAAPPTARNHNSHKATRSGRGLARGGASGMSWGRAALRLPHSQLPGARTSDLESRRRQEPSLWVVARAARPSPTPRGPAGRGAGSGQHEPGGPAGRHGAGDGRGAAAGHPEPPPRRRRGPGESAMAGRPGGPRVAAGRSDRRPGSAGEPPVRRVATLGVTAGRGRGRGPGGVPF